MDSFGTTFLFWNIHGSPIDEQLVRLITYEGIDVVALAESAYAKRGVDLMALINSRLPAASETFLLAPMPAQPRQRKIQVFSRLRRPNWNIEFVHNRYTGWSLRTNRGAQLLMVGAHFPDIRYDHSDGQRETAIELRQDVEASERHGGWPINSMRLEAVFLDRDGVLNPHIPGDYLYSADKLIVLPGIAQAVRRLNEAGLPVIVISNQQGVGKGLMTMDDLLAIEKRMGEALRHEAAAHLDRCYYSTELARDNSPRRKPGPGMLLEAAQDFGLTLAHTVFAGDAPTDIKAGHAAGVGKTILLLSGGTKSYAEGDFHPVPDLIFPDLPRMVDYLLENRA